MKKSKTLLFLILLLSIVLLISLLMKHKENFQTSQPYDIIVIAGQSNSEGAGSSGINRQYPDDQNNVLDSDIKQLDYNNTTIKAGKEQLDNLRTTGGGSYGFGMSFARAYKAAGKLAAGRKILLINCGWKSTGVLSYYENTGKIWAVHQDSRSLYYLAKNRVLAGKSLGDPTSSVVAILWHQGEADAEKVTNANYKIQYKTTLVNMLKTLRTDVGTTNIPILMGGLCPSTFGKIPGYSTMNNVIKEITNENSSSKFAFVDSSGLSHDSNAGTKHFSKSSQIEFGKRYFNVFNNI